MKEQGVLPEMEDLAEQIGEFIHYWGFKRVHGRLWTHLFLASQPLDAADLVRQMKISKALISISLRELLEYDVIQLSGRSQRGTQLYKVNPDILSVILKVLRQREKRLVSRILAAQESLNSVAAAEKTRFDIGQHRIAALDALTKRGAATLEGLIALQSVDFGDWRNAFMADGDSEVSVSEVHSRRAEDLVEQHEREHLERRAKPSESSGRRPSAHPESHRSELPNFDANSDDSREQEDFSLPIGLNRSIPPRLEQGAAEQKR